MKDVVLEQGVFVCIERLPEGMDLLVAKCVYFDPYKDVASQKHWMWIK